MLQRPGSALLCILFIKLQFGLMDSCLIAVLYKQQIMTGMNIRDVQIFETLMNK